MFSSTRPSSALSAPIASFGLFLCRYAWSVPFLLLSGGMLAFFLHAFGFNSDPLAHAAAASGTSCTVYGKQTATPAGYGAAWNVIAYEGETGNQGLVVGATCNQDGFEPSTHDETEGSTSASAFTTYKQGYYWSGSRWKPFTYTGTSISAQSSWLSGEGRAALVPYTTQPTYFVAYTCAWVTQEVGQVGDVSKYESSWKCGCRNRECTESFWQLQAVRNPTASSLGGVQFDVNAYIAQFAPPANFSGGASGGNSGGATGGSASGGSTGGGSSGPIQAAGTIPANACVAWNGAAVPQAVIDAFNEKAYNAYKTRQPSSRASATVGGVTLTYSPFHSLCILNSGGQPTCERKAEDENYIGVNGTNKVNIAHANMNFSKSTCGDMNPLKIDGPHRTGFTMCIPSGAAWIGKESGQISQHFQTPDQGSPPAQINIDESGELVAIVRSASGTAPGFGGGKNQKQYKTGVKVQSGNCYRIEDAYKGGSGGYYKVWINGSEKVSHTGQVGFGSVGGPIQYDFGPYMYDVTTLVRLVFDKIWISKG